MPESICPDASSAPLVLKISMELTDASGASNNSGLSDPASIVLSTLGTISVTTAGGFTG
jgi:hypothetical protein